MSEEFEKIQDEEIIENEQIGEEQEEQEQEEQHVPLNKYLEEKKKRKEIEKTLKDIERQNLSIKQKQEFSDIKTFVKSKGYDDDFADVQAELFNRLANLLPKSNSEDTEILEEIEEASEYNSDILKHKKAIIEKVKKYRKADPDFSVEDALNLIKPSKVRESEIKTHVEQVSAAARRNAESKKQVTSSSSSSKDPYPLDEVDKKALAGLQKFDPTWTKERYYKLIKK